MSKTKELWSYLAEEKVWVGKYLNSHNISHWHNDYELVYVNNGRIDIMVGGQTYSLKEKDSLLIESKKIHNMHAQIDNTIVSIFIFDQSLINKSMQNLTLETPLLTNNYNLEKTYNLLLKELSEKPSFYETNTKILIQDLLIKIFRNEKLINKSPNKKINENLLYLIDQINSNYQFFSFDEAVKIMNMNPSYFSRFFHNMIGISFAKYLNCVRVEKAVEFLQNKKFMSMSEIAEKCGFQTIRNFNRIFKSYTNYTPSNIPSNFTFNGLSFYNDTHISNPTLNSCKLIEYSSPHN